MCSFIVSLKALLYLEILMDGSVDWCPKKRTAWNRPVYIRFRPGGEPNVLLAKSCGWKKLLEVNDDVIQRWITTKNEIKAVDPPPKFCETEKKEKVGNIYRWFIGYSE